MNFFDFFRYGFGLIFFAFYIIIIFCFFLEWLREKKTLKQPESEVDVSVIIPVHNEGKRILGLLRTLLLQSCTFQVIFIDDRSTDNTSSLISQFVLDASKQGINCKVITINENPGPNCKQYALIKGIPEADGKKLLFTDGDCEVPPGWVSAMAKQIQNEETGAVIGPVFKKEQGKGFFYDYQCYDHVIRYYYLAGAVGIGAAGGCFGNNLIVSRNALEAIGGYHVIPWSQTEDASLISYIHRNTKYKVRAAFDSDTAVVTASEKSWSALINQTLRWNNGGLFSPEFKTRFNYNILMLLISTGILVIPLLPFFPKLWPLSVIVFITMTANTLAAFCFLKIKFFKNGLLPKFGYFLSLLFMPFYLTFMTLMGYARIKPLWRKDVKAD